MKMFQSCYTKNGTANNEEAEYAMQQMEELSSLFPEGAIDEPGPKDIFSQVMGKDPNGDASMFGLGVRCRDVWGVTPSRSACRRENMKYKSACEKLTNEVANSGGSPQRLNATNTPQPLRVGAEVYLKSIFNSTENIAKGFIRSLNPNVVVGGEEIGPNWCEINVQVAIKADERLIRPYGLIASVQDAIGATVAWPCNFISVERED